MTGDSATYSFSDHSFTMSSHGSNISAQFGSPQSIAGTSSSPSLDQFLHSPHHQSHHPPAAAQHNVALPMTSFVNDSGIYSVPSREANNVASNNASNGSSSSGPEGIPGWFRVRE